ncbi:hypothetical protein PVAND_005493 [Polypedilum vanderplanki]|uniref:Enoyl-CoA delta isomerase 1, mitochondrial n=1 Tax=Polypedilum vanderplanki TaxID=319348 RepID=A0A9J6C055_POLVA|nr:hypothetical protein PVAND_005493 [Polypedilum vanderplanki]
MLSSKFIHAFTRQIYHTNLITSATFNVIKKHNSTHTKNDLVLVDVNDKTGFSIVTLNRPPVNSLNLELLSAFSSVLDDLHKNNSRGMILTSSSSTVFSAGLDINELYKPDMDRVRKFWTSLQDCWIKLYGSSFPTAAAINGHAPAGGCLFAMCCEYRVMLPKYTIGLNETQLGIVAPTWFMATMKNTIPLRQAELALTLGKMFKTDDALKLGLIDEIAENKEDAIHKCEIFLKKYQKIPQTARALTKQSYRKNDIMELENNREADLQLFFLAISDPRVQSSLGKYVAFLKLKSRMKPILEAVKFLKGIFKSKKKKN